MTRALYGVAAAVLLAGCGATKAPTTADYYASSSYQNRELLSQSLFRSDAAVLSNEEIERALSSRIELPAEAHLAVLRLGSLDEALTWAFLTGADHPLAAVSQSPRVARVSWLPSLLVPEKLTVPLLREAAARFQADLLFIFRTPCQRFSNYRLFGSDTARTYCIAEGVLLDVRSGIVPFSSVATKEVEATESSSDVSFHETMKKAESGAIVEALGELGQQLADFLQAAP